MDSDRNAALYRQRMAQTNRSIGTVGGPPPQQASFDPRLAVPPHRPMSAANPAPPGAPRPVTRLTGSSRKITPAMDPANSYKNLKEKELQTGEAEGSVNTMLEGLNRLVVGIIIIMALSVGWVVQPKLRIFWLIIVTLLSLTYATFALYREWMSVGKKGGENAHYAEWASIMLYCLVMLFTAVVVGILFFMAWSLYSIANSKTNIARLDRAAVQDYKHDRSSKRYV